MLDFWTDTLHEGIVTDSSLEYSDIVLNVTKINNFTRSELQWNSVANIVTDGMSLEYLMEFDRGGNRLYVLEDLDRSALEKFVNQKMNSSPVWFWNPVSKKYTEWDKSTLIFMVNSIESTDKVVVSDVPDPFQPTNPSIDSDSKQKITIGIIIGIVVFCISIVIGVGIYRYRRNEPLSITNALVVMISIGDYSDGRNISPKSREVKGYFSNLSVEKDTKTLKDLAKFMNWTFVSKDNKIKWTEKEIVSFLENEIGEMLFTANGTLNFDGLIVCISCHGIKDKIVTSDLKTMDKTAIHRLISNKYPKLRQIPRIFLFDCCNGSDDRQPSVHQVVDNGNDIKELNGVDPPTPKSTDGKGMGMVVMGDLDDDEVLSFNNHNNANQQAGDEDDEHQKLIKLKEYDKGTELENIQKKGSGWTTNTKHPDYNLTVVHAATPGYVAKMNDDGSYLVSTLAEEIRQNVKRKKEKSLAEMLEDVQNALHDKGKQQTVNQLNNQTRTLLLKKNPTK